MLVIVLMECIPMLQPYPVNHVLVLALIVFPLNSVAPVSMDTTFMVIRVHACKPVLMVGFRLELTACNANPLAKIARAPLVLVLIVYPLTSSINRPVYCSVQMEPLNNLQIWNVCSVRVPVRFARMQLMSVLRVCLAIPSSLLLV